jgi:mannosyltransferase
VSEPAIAFLKRNEKALWLALIIGVAALVRFYGLTFQSYWFDELFSAHYSDPAHSFMTVVRLTLADVHPPLYQLAMWASYHVFGYTEWAGRLPSALAGVLTVPVIYFLGRELFDKRTGLYAAALAVANFYLLYYAQEARSYAFLYFLGSLSFLYFIRALRAESRLNLALYISATLALVYTHYFGFVIMLAQGCVACAYIYRTGWPNRPLINRAAIACIVIALAVAPLVPVILSHSALTEFWIEQPSAGFLADYLQAYFGSVVITLLVVLLIIYAIGKSLFTETSQPARFAVQALLIWIALGYLVPWLRGFVGQPVLTDRNTIMLVPPLLLLAGYGLASLPGVLLQRLVVAGLVAYSFYYLLVPLDYYSSVQKHQYREITAAMSQFEPTVPVPVYALRFNDTKFNVYFSQHDSALVAQDASEHLSLLQNGTPPPLLWLARGFSTTLDFEVLDEYHLSEVGRYTYIGVAAQLLVNPAVATRLTLQSQATPELSHAVYITAGLPAHEEKLRLLVAVNQVDRTEFAGELQLELLGEDRQVVLSEISTTVEVPVVIELEPAIAGVTLRVTLPVDSSAPEVWLMQADN